ncbi:MAG: MmcB family DNA repair protein [Methylocystis sp.]|uniref:MmcB family DNA repair protein n=1 Tax=Methylocystis sp. TaxID=1911079 RepID=UPI003DA40C11
MRETSRPEETARVTRGARRFLRACGFAVLGELPLPNGRRADLVALAPDGALRIVEVKSSRADFQADRKWTDYRDYCDRFYFAASTELDAAIFPEDAGLIVADAHGGMLAREAPILRLAPASRRAMLIRFGALAAERYCALAFGEDAPV